MAKATIENLKINPGKTLDSATKRQLQWQIERIFSRKCSQYDSAIKEQKEKLMERYRKSVNFTKLKATINKKEFELEEAQKALTKTGLDKDGDIRRFSYHEEQDPEMKSAIKICKNLQDQIDALAVQDPEELKEKIIARLWCSSTIGEATVIVNQVMGNGIIPTLDTKALTMQ